jgi:hypothetical protein
MMAATVDTAELEAKVKEMYRHVAQEPGGDYHFELGESLALRVGYDADRLRKVPAGAPRNGARLDHGVARSSARTRDGRGPRSSGTTVDG